ncbi:MAG: hypothetical protein CVT80_00405 [Alphaproteobacteria bacterium HGW-Alphaproteobacteria-2]|nr:MAG: hypothetical protein CVT80_00405 [Alphaproteobacteria bacterium HGW-Alphaproteobacteria-2]
MTGMEKAVMRRLSEEELAVRDTIIAILDEIGGEVSVHDFLVGMIAAMIEICEEGSAPGEAASNRLKLADMLAMNDPGAMGGLVSGRVQ